MFWNTDNLNEFSIEATDGRIGSVIDCLFHDDDWMAKWFVVDSGTWLPGRQVLLPTAAVTPHEDRRSLGIDLTIRQVKDSPGIDTDAPVSRQHERAIFQHYGWSPYWEVYPLAGGAAPIWPDPLTHRMPHEGADPQPEPQGDPHLRSIREVTGYRLHARDGEIGHIEEFLLDPNGWVLRYIVVDTRNWWPGRRVLVLPRMVTAVDYPENAIDIDMTREAIRSGPEYDRMQTIDRGWEERFYQHHKYPSYW